MRWRGSVGLSRRAGKGTYRGDGAADADREATLPRALVRGGPAVLPLGGGARRLLGARGCRRRVLARHSGRLGRSGVVAAAVVGPRADLAVAAVVALRGVGAAAARLPRGAARFGPGLPVSSARWMFSRSLLTVLLTLRKFLRTSLSVVSRSLRTSRVPLVELHTQVLKRFLGGLDGLREPVHRSLLGALGSGGSAAHASRHGRSPGRPESPRSSAGSRSLRSLIPSSASRNLRLLAAHTPR